MHSKDRRDFLKLCTRSIPALVFANCIEAGGIESRASAQPAYRKPSSLDRYIDPLPLPKLLMPHRTDEDGVQYRIRMLEFTQQLHSQLPPQSCGDMKVSIPVPPSRLYGAGQSQSSGITVCLHNIFSTLTPTYMARRLQFRRSGPYRIFTGHAANQKATGCLRIGLRLDNRHVIAIRTANRAQRFGITIRR